MSASRFENIYSCQLAVLKTYQALLVSYQNQLVGGKLRLCLDTLVLTLIYV
jgi:hypothetical protein